MTTPRVAMLEPLVVDQIAAGEVVERPASVVRELLDNAKDAGARTISVHVDGGGLGRIEVVDDGHGMTQADATLAVERHATSKIRNADDLLSLSTFGFRGEALPSIASVARLRIRTRTSESESGTEVLLSEGQKTVRAIACEIGTAVSVEELFATVPVRKKFLKAAGTESAWVSEAVTEAALANAELRVVLFRDGRRALEYLPVKTLYERVAQVFGGERLIGIEAARGGITVAAMLSAPERARNTSTSLYLYVNGRRIRDRALARAVQFAYGSVLPSGRYPAGAVFVALDPARVDVNVHPQKSEVRFQDARTIYDAVARALADGLGTQPFARVSEQPRPAPVAITDHAPADATPQEHFVLREADPWGLATSSSVDAGLSSETFVTGALPGITSALPGNLRALAQAYRTYIVCEGNDGLLFLDQHAADERVRFDRFKRTFSEHTIAKQRLLFPERVSLTEQDVAFAIEHNESLSRMGLDVTEGDAQTLFVHSVPSLVRKIAPEKLLRDVLSELNFSGSRAFGDRLDMALATMACHAAIRAGDELSVLECQALLHELAGVESFEGYCPHGRPVAFQISKPELARGVGRAAGF